MLDTEPQIRRFSIDDVYKMDEAGVLGPEERVELIDGVLYEMMRGEQPSAAELVIEVSVSTKRHDRAKADRYARSNVAEYWIVDPDAGSVTVHRNPRDGSYGSVARHERGESIPTSVGAPPVEIAALLG